MRQVKIIPPTLLAEPSIPIETTRFGSLMKTSFVLVAEDVMCIQNKQNKLNKNNKINDFFFLHVFCVFE